MDKFIDQATVATVVVYLVQLLKQFGWYQQLATAIPMANTYVHRTVGIVAALASGIGITWTVMWTGGSGGDVVFHIPSLAVMGSMAWVAIQNLIMQEGFHARFTS